MLANFTFGMEHTLLGASSMYMEYYPPLGSIHLKEFTAEKDVNILRTKFFGTKELFIH